jgi:hypothetical protein
LLGLAALWLLRRLGGAAAAQAPEHAAAWLRARRTRRQVLGHRLADPAVVLGAVEAEVADLMPMAARREVRLGPLPFENCAAADVAGHDVVNRPKLLLHGAR